MNPERWRTVGALFHAALERDAASRDAFLRDAAGGDEDLAREVQSLLAHHAHSSPIDVPAWRVPADLLADPAEEDGPIGRTLGPYAVRRELGRGGMGVVYEAEDTRLGRTVALKALPRQWTRDAARRERLVREARAAAALSHPNVATVHALEEFEGDLFIVSELVEGRTLREEIGTGPPAPPVLLRTLIDVASALAAAHALGIVHRDLKPENIVRCPDGRVKILDFGIARVDRAAGLPTSERLTEAGAVLGTPGYMAPEQLAGSEVDGRADVFAFGVLAWELATGEHPFGSDPAAMLSRLTALMNGREPTGAACAVPGLEAIARRCLRPAPAERFGSAELVKALTRVSAGAAADGSPATGRPLWWWTFHQAVTALLNGATLIPAWYVRTWMERPIGSWAFYLLLVLATSSVTLRLNLLFMARVHPELLRPHHRRLIPWIRGVDAGLAAVLLGSAYVLAGTRDGVATALVVIGVASLVSLVTIEPGTSAAAGLGPQATRER